MNKRSKQSTRDGFARDVFLSLICAISLACILVVLAVLILTPYLKSTALIGAVLGVITLLLADAWTWWREQDARKELAEQKDEALRTTGTDTSRAHGEKLLEKVALESARSFAFTRNMATVRAIGHGLLLFAAVVAVASELDLPRILGFFG